MQGLKNDAEFILNNLIFEEDFVIKNRIGTIMEERSLCLSKAWLGDEKSIQDAIVLIEKKSKWMVKLLDKVIDKIREEIKKSEMKEQKKLNLDSSIEIIKTVATGVLGATTSMVDTILPSFVLKLGLVTSESIIAWFINGTKPQNKEKWLELVNMRTDY